MNGDNYDLLSELEAARARYVIRLANNRKLVGEREKLKQVVGRAECLFRRELRVSPRTALLRRRTLWSRRDAPALREIARPFRDGFVDHAGRLDHTLIAT